MEFDLGGLMSILPSFSLWSYNRQVSTRMRISSRPTHEDTRAIGMVSSSTIMMHATKKAVNGLMDLSRQLWQAGTTKVQVCSCCQAALSLARSLSPIGTLATAGISYSVILSEQIKHHSVKVVSISSAQIRVGAKDSSTIRMMKTIRNMNEMLGCLFSYWAFSLVYSTGNSSRQLKVCIPNTQMSWSPSLYLQLSPEYTSEANHPCTVLTMTRSTTSPKKNPAQTREHLKTQTTPQKSSMAARHSRRDPIIRSQFMSPIAKSKLIREMQSQQGVISLAGTLYRKVKLEKSSPITKLYKFTLTECGQMQQQVSPSSWMACRYSIMIRQMYLVRMRTMRSPNTARNMPIRQQGLRLRSKYFCTNHTLSSVEVCALMEQMTSLGLTRLSANLATKECEYTSMPALTVLLYSTMELLLMMALLMVMGRDVGDRRRRRWFSTRVLVTSVMKVREMYVFQLVFRVVWTVVFRPSSRGIVNFSDSAVYTDTLMLRGYPPGSTQARILSLAWQYRGHSEQHTFSKLYIPNGHKSHLKVTLLPSYPSGHKAIQVQLYRYRTTAGETKAQEVHIVEELTHSAQAVRVQAQHLAMSYIRLAYWPAGQADTHAVVSLRMKQLMQHSWHVPATLQVLQFVGQATQFPEASKPWQYPTSGQRQVWLRQLGMRMPGQIWWQVVPFRNDQQGPLSVQLIQLVLPAAVQVSQSGSQSWQTPDVPNCPAGHAASHSLVTTLSTKVTPHTEQSLRLVHVTQLGTQYAIRHCTSLKATSGTPLSVRTNTIRISQSVNGTKLEVQIHQSSWQRPSVTGSTSTFSVKVLLTLKNRVGLAPFTWNRARQVSPQWGWVTCRS